MGRNNIFPIHLGNSCEQWRGGRGQSWAEEKPGSTHHILGWSLTNFPALINICKNKIKKSKNLAFRIIASVMKQRENSLHWIRCYSWRPAVTPDVKTCKCQLIYRCVVIQLHFALAFMQTSRQQAYMTDRDMSGVELYTRTSLPCGRIYIP